MGPEAGRSAAATSIAEGTVPADRGRIPASQIGPFLGRAGGAPPPANARAAELFARGASVFPPGSIHTVKPLEVDTAQGAADRCDGRVRLRQDDAGAGEPCPGAGRRSIDGQAAAAATSGPLERGGHRATSSSSMQRPSGINVRSTVATYANVHDELRKVFARTPDAERLAATRRATSPTTPGTLRCPGL